MAYKDDSERARQRVEAWWNGAVIDRACIQARAPRGGTAPAAASRAPAGRAGAPLSQGELEAWFLDPGQVFPRLRSAIAHRSGGWFFWMGFWSEHPAVDLQSDFSCMISAEAFRTHFLPSLEEQTRMVERTIYHLDGPNAIRHVDALLELPRLSGVQWIQGAGAGPVTRFLSLLKRIQDAGKLVSFSCRLQDLAAVMDALRPEGVHIVMEDLASAAEADEAVRRISTWTTRRA